MAATEITETDLRAWAQTATGATIDRWERLAAGNSRTTWLACATDGRRLVVRRDTGDGPYSGTPLTLGREAAIYQALQGTGIPVARVYGYDDGQDAVILEHMPGEPAWDGAVLDGLLAELGRLHALDPAALDLPDDFGAAARDDVELWAGIAQRKTAPLTPLVAFAIDFLRERFPGEPRRIALVHGDAGPGNVLWHDGRITALLDWEMSHLGDPHDDLAFLSVRAALFGHDLPDFAQRVATRYTPPPGVALAPERLRYWQAVSVLRNLLACLASLGSRVRGRDRLVHAMLRPSLDRLLVGVMAEIAGVELEPAPPAPETPHDLPGSDVLSELAEAMDDVVAAIGDEEPRLRAKRVRFLLAQLAQTWPRAFAIEEAEAAEPPAATEADRLRQLARSADRRLLLFPRASAIAHARLAGLNPST